MAKSRKRIPNRNKGRIAQPSYMPRNELRSLLEQFGLNSLTGARFLRIHPRSLARLIKGEVPIDARTAMLLRVMAKFRISPEEVSNLLED